MKRKWSIGPLGRIRDEMTDLNEIRYSPIA
jgi:hypothetical protein